MFPYPNLEHWQTHVQIIKIFPFWIMKYTGRFTLPHQQFLCPGPIVPFHAAHFFNSTASLLSQLARNVVEQSLEETGNRPSRDVSVDRDHLRAHRSLDCWQRVGYMDSFFLWKCTSSNFMTGRTYMLFQFRKCLETRRNTSSFCSFVIIKYPFLC